MKNIIAALILGFCIILAAFIHAGIYRIEYITLGSGRAPVAINRFTGHTAAYDPPPIAKSPAAKK